MKKYMSGFIGVALLSSGALAENILINTSFYGSYLDYSSSAIKDNGYIGGIYGYLGIGLGHSVEGEVDYTKVNYTGSGSLKQWDFTLLYTNYSVKNIKLRIGGHYISSDDRATDSGFVLTGGYEFYTLNSYNYSIDLAYSHYSNYNVEKTYIRSSFRNMGRGSFSFTSTKTGLSVYQISPKFGYLFPNISAGKVYLETWGYYIRLSDDVGFGKNFFSIEGNIDIDIGSFAFNLYGWMGEQEFAVKKYGFAVYNLSEKYKSGFGASIKYKMSKKSSVTVGIKRGTFKELDNPSDVKVTSLYFLTGVAF